MIPHKNWAAGRIEMRRELWICRVALGPKMQFSCVAERRRSSLIQEAVLLDSTTNDVSTNLLLILDDCREQLFFMEIRKCTLCSAR